MHNQPFDPSLFIINKFSSFIDPGDIFIYKPSMIFYGAVTPWWTCKSYDLIKLPSGIPCDPLGGVLFQTNKIEAFMKSATENPSHYGKYGIKTFMLAHHGNVLVKNTKQATALKNWDEYNKLIDYYASRNQFS